MTPDDARMDRARPASRSSAALLVAAGLFGAVGVATAAAGAHMSADPRLATAASFLMLHAAALPAVVAAAAALRLGRLLAWPAWGLAAGTLLFSGDLIVRVAFGASPLPMVAPTGGTILIASWLAVALGAAIGVLRKR